MPGYTFDWTVILPNLRFLLQGALVSIEVTAGALTLGVALGMIVAFIQIAGGRIGRSGAQAYIQVIRGSPLLVQLLWIYYGLPIVLGIVIPNWAAAVLGIGVHSGAYFAEIFRAGIESIEKSQGEAAWSLGFTWWHTMRRIILPQAYKRLLPPTGNMFVAFLKDSSLVSIIAIPELLRTGQLVANRTFRPIEVYTVVGLVYLAMTLPLGQLVLYAERKLGVRE